jgi:hypothetical protein
LVRDLTYIVSFDSTSHALMAEKFLQDHFEIETIGTPSSITSNCGLSIILHNSSLDSIKNVLGTLKVKCTLYGVDNFQNNENDNVLKLYTQT